MLLKFLHAINFILFGNGQSTNGANTTQEIFMSLNCIPNKMFIYDHNICYCDDKGEKITCKRKMYSTLYPELHAYHLQNLTINCPLKDVGKKVLDIGCYKCICTDNNHATCIPSGCDNKNSAAVKKCIPGSIFSNQCNGCICGQDGTATCTNLDCLTLHGIRKPEDVLCIPNSTLIVECNECSCNHFGTSISCEKVSCDYPNFIHRHILNVTGLCIPKKVFNYDACHKCVCSNTGTFAMCSGEQCNIQYDIEGDSNIKDSVDRCNPGIIFYNDCNVCICSEAGKGVCTTLKCDIRYNFKYVKQLTYSSSADENQLRSNNDSLISINSKNILTYSYL